MKKNRGDEPVGVIIHIYTWKYHKEIPYVATFISNKQKHNFFFFCLQNQRTGRWNRSCGWGEVEGGSGGKSGVGHEYGANTVCKCM
jgi:hypothetical protein